jgi:polysaccharide biosynthesis transport protein
MNASPDASLHLDHWRIHRSRIGLAILVFLLSLAGAAVFAYFSPKSYMAAATVDIRTSNAQQPVGRDSTTDSTKVPNFDENQLQAVFSREVLDPVIQRLDLQTKWSENGTDLSLESAYDKLRHMVVLEVLAPHSLRISVQGISPQQATLLANTIAQEYINEQTFRQQASLRKEADRLKEEVRLKETTVSNLFAEASRLRTAAGYVDPNPDSSDTSLRPAESISPTSEEKVNEVQASIANLKSRLDALDRLKSDNLAEATGLLNLNDPVLEQKLPLYQNAITEKGRLLSAGLGHNHPDVRTIQTQIDTIEGQIRDEIANIRKELSAQLATDQATLVSIETNLRVNQNDQLRKEANAQYLETKLRYDSAQETLATAKAKLDSGTTDNQEPPKPAEISQLATTAWRTGRFGVSVVLLIGGAAGLIVGTVLALLTAALDRSFKTPQDVEKRLGLPLLAVIPKSNRQPMPMDSEKSYQILKQNVHLARQKVAASVLAIVSGGSGEGRSTTAAELAMAYAAGEQQTLVIDAALRRPNQHKLFGIGNQTGLSDYLRGEKSFDEIIQENGTPNLFVVTGGSSPASAIDLLNSPKLVELIETAKDWFDVVIIDSAPILAANGSMTVCGLAEASIIVAQHRRYPRALAIKTKDALQTLSTKILGVVLSKALVKRRPKKLLLSMAVTQRPKKEIEAAEFEAARLRGDDAY